MTSAGQDDPPYGTSVGIWHTPEESMTGGKLTNKT